MFIFHFETFQFEFVISLDSLLLLVIFKMEIYNVLVGELLIHYETLTQEDALVEIDWFLHWHIYVLTVHTSLQKFGFIIYMLKSYFTLFAFRRFRFRLFTTARRFWLATLTSIYFSTASRRSSSIGPSSSITHIRR